MSKGHPNPNNAGRKWFDGRNYQETITKLEQAWSIGCSDAEAALIADISTASLSRFLTAHPLIAERKEKLKNKPNIKARQEVVKGLDNDKEFSLKYLERKMPEEFAPQSRVEHKADNESLNQLVSGIGKILKGDDGGESKKNKQ